jgi:hypothetical protein
MVRTNRQLLRVYFVLVLAMAGFGAWYGAQAWEARTAEMLANAPQVAEEDDGTWVEFISALGEEAIQLFLGFASGE